MDDSNSANKYSLRICVKTTFCHLIAESLKVIIKGKVYVVRAKKVTGWVPDFGEDNSDESEDYSDNNSVGKKNWVESEEGEIIPESTFHQALEESVNKSSGVSKTAHADSMAGPVKQQNRFTNRRFEINNLMVLQDHPLVDYGKYALGCMTGADMKKCVHLKSVRGELLRSMEEKRQLMKNYRDM
nr:RNA-directed DNA polymerase, eukaryota, reverse transcriptase zinc-binding domain protein [Tanacetum cinerariifolium]